MNHSTPNSVSGKSNVLFVLIAAIAIALGLVVQQIRNQPVTLPEFEKLAILGAPKSLGEVRFTDHNGTPFNDANLQNKWTILFFAFTNCPDVCPSTLHTLKQVKQSLTQQGLWSQFQVAMVTVDPARDTSERLKSYVPFFDPAFIGLRADLDYTKEFAKNMGILFFKSKEFDNGGYDIDHGAALVLVNPKGQFAGVFNAPHPQDLLTRDLAKLGEYAAKTSTSSPTKGEPNQESIQATPVTESVALDGLAFNQAWVRSAPPAAMSMAGYLNISNQGDKNVRLIGASSPLFESVMIHQTSMHDGMMSMDHVDGIDIPARQSIELKPMGTHLMLMQPRSPLPEGSVIPVSLKFSSGKLLEVRMTVANEAP